jgi:hypothetical protein
VSSEVKASGSAQRPRREPRNVTRIVVCFLGIAFLVLVPFAIFFIAAVMYAAAKAGG